MAPVRSSYRAAQAVSRGKLELTEKPLRDPLPGDVPIRVEPDGQSQSEGDGVGVVRPFGPESKQESDAAIQPPAGSCGTAAFHKERVIVSDIASHPLWSGVSVAQLRDVALTHGLRAAWSQPLISVSFLASDESSYVTGIELFVDGGLAQI